MDGEGVGNYLILPFWVETMSQQSKNARNVWSQPAHRNVQEKFPTILPQGESSRTRGGPVCSPAREGPEERPCPYLQKSISGAAA